MKSSNYCIALTLAWLFGATTAAANVGDGWIVKITSKSGDHRSIVTLGAKSDATDAYDVLYDAPVYSSLTLPALSSRFPHPEWGRGDRDYLYDIRALAERQQWTFDTESEEFVGRDIELSWDVAALPSDYALTLTDTATGESVDMSEQAGYSYFNNGPRSFTVVAAQRAQTTVDGQTTTTPAPVSNSDTRVNLTGGSAGGGGPLHPLSLAALLLAWPLARSRRRR